MNHNESFMPQAEPYRHKTRRNKLWRRFVSALGCGVVFLTTYMLILPAMTLDDSPICGYEEHRHDSSCYLMPEPDSQLHCSAVPHRHTEECGDSCGYADFFIHSHDTDYSVLGEFVCKLPEIEAHTHDDSCYTERFPTVCGLDESAGHVHDEGCFTECSTLICTEPEVESHTHTDGCFDESGEPVCGLVESQGHTHGEECYTVSAELTCTEPESEGHIHTDACKGEAEKVLVCQKPEYILHTHTDDCFDKDGKWICGQIELLEHIHGENCLAATAVQGEPVLICEKTEHLHSDSCFPAPDATDTTVLTDPAEIVEGTEPTGIIEGTEPTEVTEPTEIIEVTDPTEVIEVTDPTEVTEPVEQDTVTLTAVIYTDGTYAELSGDTTVITVTGLIPEGAQVLAYPVTLSTENVLCAYDLTIFLADGTVFEPAEGQALDVVIHASELHGDSYYPEVYYIPEDGEPEPIDTEITEDGVRFQTDHFSTYAVMAVDTQERIPIGAAGSYYHSNSMPRYQVSPYRVNERIILYNSVYAVETFVLVSVDDYGGTTWTPDSTNWTASGNHNYVVCYCSDFDNNVSTDGRTFYLYKIPLDQSKFNANQRAGLRAIVENSYPFITEAEMRQRLNDAGYTGTFTAAEMMTATQLAIWHYTDNEHPSVYDNVVPDNKNVLNPITTKGPGSKNDVQKIYDYLLKDATSADPGDLEVTDTQWIFNEDGSYTVNVTLNRPVLQGETINAALTSGSKKIQIDLEPGTTEFSLTWPAGLNEGTNITLSVSGSRPYFKVFYYDDGGRVQDLISGEMGYKEMCYTEVLVRSTTNISVKKVWVETDPSLRPAEITVYLTVNGERLVKDGVSPIVLNESNKWQYKWSNLPTASKDSTLVYGIEEIIPEGYSSKITRKESNHEVTYTITNTQIPVQFQTSLCVVKEWADGNDLHADDSVIVRLYADGVYTGLERVLNQGNNWTAVFEGLPYYQEDGITVIQYTVVELEVPGYVPEYSLAIPSDAIEMTAWNDSSDLEPGKLYRFIAGGLALGCDTNGDLAAIVDDDADINQWWQAASAEDGWILINAATGKSIVYCDGIFTTGDQGTILSFKNGMFSCTDDDMIIYLQVSGAASFNNASVFTVLEKNTIEKAPTYTITITNRIEPSYELPHTGSFGAEVMFIGGAILLAAAWLCGSNRRNKRESA